MLCIIILKIKSANIWGEYLKSLIWISFKTAFGFRSEDNKQCSFYKAAKRWAMLRFSLSQIDKTEAKVFILCVVMCWNIAETGVNDTLTLKCTFISVTVYDSAHAVLTAFHSCFSSLPMNYSNNNSLHSYGFGAIFKVIVLSFQFPCERFLKFLFRRILSDLLEKMMTVKCDAPFFVYVYMNFVWIENSSYFTMHIWIPIRIV